VTFSPPVTATELVHRMVNPNFGGNPLNGNFLINQANEQNNTKESVPVADTAGTKTELQRFTDSLKSSILSGLARATAGNLIGSDGNLVPNSTINVGDFSVSVGDVVSGGVTVSISDGISSTTLIIPRVNQ
jgi:curli production assembly/transport component CsgF